jgi:hypothetical protein
MICYYTEKNSNKKTLRAHKHIQQSSQIPNKYTKTSSISIHKQWTDQEKHQENNPFHNHIIKNLRINLTHCFHLLVLYLMTDNFLIFILKQAQWHWCSVHCMKDRQVRNLFYLIVKLILQDWQFVFTPWYSLGTYQESQSHQPGQ